MSLTPALRPVIYLTGLVRKDSASSRLSVAPGDSGRNSEPLHSCRSCYSKTARRLLHYYTHVYTLHIVCLFVCAMVGWVTLPFFLFSLKANVVCMYARVFPCTCVFVQG